MDRSTAHEIISNTFTGEYSDKIESSINEIAGDDQVKYKNVLFEVIVDTSRGQDPGVTIELLNKQKSEWKHPGFEDNIFKQREQDEFIKNPFEVEEGVLQCPKCSKSRTFSYSKQTRSADEPMTTFATCMSCKHKWTYSG